MKAYGLNSIFPSRGSWKYKGKTIEEVLKQDSGYIKDLIKLHSYFCLSEECMLEAQLMTKGFQDKWVKPEKPTTILDNLKTYGVPYDFDFNNDEIIHLNKQKLNK